MGNNQHRPLNRLTDIFKYLNEILEAPNTDRWGWHRGLDKDTTDEQFLEIINNNRQMYGLQKSSYTQSDMAKAARLLDDEMQYEI